MYNSKIANVIFESKPFLYSESPFSSVGEWKVSFQVREVLIKKSKTRRLFFICASALLPMHETKFFGVLISS